MPNDPKKYLVILGGLVCLGTGLDGVLEFVTEVRLWIGGHGVSWSVVVASLFGVTVSIALLFLLVAMNRAGRSHE